MPKVVVEVGDVIDQFMKYDAEIKRLRKALKFYSCLCDDDSDLFNCPYDKSDTNRCGWKARAALGEKE